MDVLTGDNLSSVKVAKWFSFIGRFIHPIGEVGMGLSGYRYLCQVRVSLIKGHTNLVQHPSNYKYIDYLSCATRK